jgi:phage-related protein
MDQNSSIIVLGSQEPALEPMADIVWEGSSRKVLRGFPEAPRCNLGYSLWLLQQGVDPPGSTSVPGLEGVFELRDQDERAWYRVLYLKRIKGKIHVLHCFEKRSNRIEKRDIVTAKMRLKQINARGRAAEESNGKAGGTTRNARKRTG